MIVDHCQVRHIWAAGVGFSQPLNTSVEAYIRHSTIEDCGHEAIDTHSPGTIEMAYNLIKDSQVGFNLHDNITANIHHNIVLNTTFPVICINSSDVFVTQCVLNAQIQDNTRWTYSGWTMPQFQDPAAVFVTNSTQSHVIVTNSIIFDSPTGLKNDAPEGSLGCGYLNMDNVTVAFATNAIQGAGCLNVSSGFVNKDNLDFHLQANSLCKGAGNPEDGSPDLGAYGGSNAETVIGYSN